MPSARGGMQNASQPRGRGWRRAGKAPRRGRALARPPEGFLARGGVSTHGCPSPVCTQPRDSPCQLLTAVGLDPPGGCGCAGRSPGGPTAPIFTHITAQHRHRHPVVGCPCSESILLVPAARPRLCHPRLGTAQPHLRPSSVVRQQSKHARKKKCDSKGDFSGRGGTVSAAFCFVFLR